jgi:predicted protein tyrosine phosphatase
MSAPWIANRAEAWVQANAAPEGAVVISITDPGREAALPSGYRDVLRLQFHDCDPEAAALGPEAVPMHPEQAELIWVFARRHRGRNVVVHCGAGVSRSRAVVEALSGPSRKYEKTWGRIPHAEWAVLRLLVRRHPRTAVKD